MTGGPVIIVGTGRCGSTLLHRVLALHRDLGWLSPLNEVLPGQPWLSVFSNAYRWALPARIRHLKAFPKPYEAYRFWDHYLPGFSRRDRPPTARDVDESRIGPVRDATRRVLAHQRKPRLLVKVTGWSRIGFFDRIYADAVFVSLRRDPRAVVSSWAQAGWLDVTSPPDSERWQWGAVPAPYFDVWRELGGGPFLSVAVKMRLDLDDIATNMALFPSRSHELWYEELVARPEPTLRELCRFCGLDWTPQFRDVVDGLPIQDARGKWKRHLTEEQGDRILEFFERTDAFAELPVGVRPAAAG
jgi:hypothetical protein